MQEEEVDVKCDFQNDLLTQCCVCLSVGRRLIRLGDCLQIFRKLTRDLEYSNKFWESDVIMVCWECHTVLHKVLKFQRMVARANKVAQNYHASTLSNLKTTILNEINDIIIETTDEEYIDTRLLEHIDGIDNEYLQHVKIEPGSLCQDFSDSNKYLHDEKIEPESPYQDNNDSNDAFPDTIEENSNILQNITETTKKPVENVNLIVKEETEKHDVVTKAKNKTLYPWYVHMRKENKQKYRLISEINDIKKLYERIEMNFDGKTAGSDCEASNSEYFCNKCTVVFDTESNLLDHLNKHHGSKQYVCNICHHIFFKKCELSSHIKRWCRLYKCIVCELKFESLKTLHTHMGSGHKKVYECLKCGSKFRYKRTFYKHHKENHQRYECDHCGRSFRLRYSIIEHMRRRHRNRYECDKCGKTYSHATTLWHHNKLQHGTAETESYCVECDKRFPNMYKYRQHLAKSIKHKKPKKVKVPCPDCGKVFSKKVYMNQHRNFVHLKKYNYSCAVCHKNFLRSADLIKHRKRKHEGILPPKNKICNICGRGFSTNKILTHHMRTHTGEKPNKCDVCEASFAQRTALVQHRKKLHSLRT